MWPILSRLVFQLKTQKNWIELASIFPPDLSFQFTYSSMEQTYVYYAISRQQILKIACQSLKKGN